MSDKSMEYIETAHDILDERERLESDFSLIKSDFENFKTILTNYENCEEDIYDKSKLAEIAKYILDLTNSKISSNYLMSSLDDIYSYMDIDAFLLYANCYHVASSVVFEADFDMAPYNCANTILQEIKKQSLSLNETQKNVAKERFGEKYIQVLSYEFPVSEIGLSLSIAWKELNLKYKAQKDYWNSMAWAYFLLKSKIKNSRSELTTIMHYALCIMH